MYRTIALGIALLGSVAGRASPVINAGTPDAAIVTYDAGIGTTHVVQLQYLNLLGRTDVVWFEDGSGESRVAFERQRDAWALRTLHPTGCTFLSIEVESTEDR
jgi:hypothetical protein